MDPELEQVLEELSLREPIFHRPELGTSRADFERMTAPDFWEVGASGRQYSREFVLDELDRRNPLRDDVWETQDFRCQRLCGQVYLLTYTLVQDAVRWTRRSTIWERTGDGWRILYHQGTLMQDGPPQ